MSKDGRNAGIEISGSGWRHNPYASTHKVSGRQFSIPSSASNMRSQ